ncbi:MAG TPA: type III-B CRISPR module-associated protein Cmr5 [Kofleriaceae bacterium]|nr:type III-B CRISPR module-associated protein Cmr5 [Kofleriaceae bacterium]
MSSPEIARSSEAVRRKHVVVELIERRLTLTLVKHPRVANLPEMVLRHGILQTAVFLRSKSRDSKNQPTMDGRLLELLDTCVKATTGSSITSSTLATLRLEKYMMVNEAAIEAAAWIALLAKAREAAPETQEVT